jgi:hypothetical protein
LYAYNRSHFNEIYGSAPVGQRLRIWAVYLTQPATIRSSGTRDNLMLNFMALYQGTTLVVP